MPGFLPALPGLADLKTYAAWPVWSNSTTQQIRWRPTPKLTLREILSRAQAFDRATHQPGKQGGAIGPTAMRILQCLIFKFHNAKTGQLDPSWAAIGRELNLGRTAVWAALKRLRCLGIIHWQRRAVQKANAEGGGFLLEQTSNAYSIQPWRQWHGYKPDEPPPPEQGTWGDHPSQADEYRDAAWEAVRGGQSDRGTLDIISATGSQGEAGLAAALALLQGHIAPKTSEGPPSGQKPLHQLSDTLQNPTTEASG